MAKASRARYANSDRDVARARRLLGHHVLEATIPDHPSADLRGVAVLVARKLGRKDLAAAVIDGQVQLPLAALAMLLDQPFTSAGTSLAT